MEDPFNKLINEILGESRFVVTKRRSFYPQKIQNVGGLSNTFLNSLKREAKRLKLEDQRITNQQILKAIEFELNGH